MRRRIGTEKAACTGGALLKPAEISLDTGFLFGRFSAVNGVPVRRSFRPIHGAIQPRVEVPI